MYQSESDTLQADFDMALDATGADEKAKRQVMMHVWATHLKFFKVHVLHFLASHEHLRSWHHLHLRDAGSTCCMRPLLFGHSRAEAQVFHVCLQSSEAFQAYVCAALRGSSIQCCPLPRMCHCCRSADIVPGSQNRQRGISG